MVRSGIERGRETKSACPLIDDAVAASVPAAITARCGRTTQRELSGGVARTPEALAHGVVRRHGSISALEGAVRGGERVGTINSYFS